MRAQFIYIAVIVITTFIPWLITLAALGPASSLPRFLFLAVYYAISVLLFGVAFANYFKGHQKESPFSVMGVAMLSIFFFEIVYFKYLYVGDLWFLTYLDWVVPVFLISSTIYFVGKALK
ncbi:MAG: hypothetical protein HQ488_04875 [Parcubacteria group bacterium]|nr:hypothetical protein [Parcubacteria group bacterium]